MATQGTVPNPGRGPGSKEPQELVLTTIKVLAPFIPVIVGGMLKLSLLDDVPTLDVERSAFLMNSYAKPLWLQLLVSAYILPIAAIMSGVASNKRIAALYVIPAVVFLICIILIFGLPKLAIASDLWQIWLPAIVSTICVIVLGIIHVNTPKADK